MEPETTYHFLIRAANDFGRLPAIEDDFGSLSFLDLYEASDNLRIALNKAGVGNEKVIGLALENGREFVIALFAAIGTGAVVLPIYVSLSRVERQEIYDEVGMDFLIGTTTALNKEISDYGGLELGYGCNLVDLKYRGDFKLSHIANSACMRFSSGTTGMRKGVVLSHRAIQERTKAVVHALALNSTDKVLWVLPMAFHYIATIMAFIRYGITLIICPSFYAKEIIEVSNLKSATLLYVSPMHIRLLAGDRSSDKFRSLKRVISTSSGIDIKSCELFHERFGITVSQAYGIIEVGVPLVNFDTDINHADRLGMIRTPYELVLLNDDYSEVEKGVEGKLGLKGPGMFDGYVSPPLLLKDILKNGWFMTGDNAVEMEDGSILLKGREKSVINIAGNKVFPEEVEFVLEAFDEIQEAFVFPENHPLLGEVVIAQIIPVDPAKIDVNLILNKLRTKLAPFKIPKRIAVVSDFEKTSTGKKIRKSSGSTER